MNNWIIWLMILAFFAVAALMRLKSTIIKRSPTEKAVLRTVAILWSQGWAKGVSLTFEQLLLVQEGLIEEFGADSKEVQQFMEKHPELMGITQHN